mgnify:CR=1 FL=1
MHGRGVFSLRFCCGLVLLLALVPGVAAAAKPNQLSAENRLAIIRLLAFEYASARKPLPAGEKGLELKANGEVNERQLRQELANHGASVHTGDIVQITQIEFKKDRIIFEINGGGRPQKKKWYERIEVVAGGPVGVPTGRRSPGATTAPPPITGSYVVLRFSGSVPDLTAEQVRDRITAVLDFSRRTAAVSWIETLPEEFQEAIRNKKAVVGMDREMVLAALGRPDHKVRETRNGVEEEDWIYGVPPFVTFVTFAGERVVRVKEFK